MVAAQGKMVYKNKEFSAQNQPQKADFDWSFNPFRIFIKILTGVDLLSITKTYNRKGWFPSIRVPHAYLMFLLNLIVNVMWDIELIEAIFPTPSPDSENNESYSYNDTATYDASFTPREVMEYLTSNIYYLGIHLAFLLATICEDNKSSWARLWSQIGTIQKECGLNICDQYGKCRSVVIFGLVFILMVPKNLNFIKVNCFKILLTFIGFHN